MPIFTYQGRDSNGRLVKGDIEAPSKEAAADKLVGSGFLVTSISSKQNILDINLSFFDQFATVKTNDIVALTIQLSNMLGAGIILPTALNILAEQTENPKLKATVKTVSENIRKGETFSEALKKHPSVFSTLFVNMIASAEVTGNLEEVLGRLAKFAEREADLKQKLATAMMYPMILLVMGLTVVIGIVLFLIPSFITIYKDAKITLPFPTRVLFEMNLFLRSWWHVSIVTAAGLIFAFRWYVNTKDGRIVFDQVKLKLPLWGPLIRKITIARMARTLATLLNGGVAMIQSLETTNAIIDNEVISRVITNLIEAVKKGEPLSQTLKASGQFPPMVTQMIAVGEETGTLDILLTKVADYYDLETDYSLKRLTAMLEPIFLIVIGGIVGFIFASIILPIFEMAKNLHH